MNELKTVLITGGNAGIGRQTALTFTRHGWEVVITSREAENGRRAVADIGAATRNPRVRYLLGDLSTVRGCRALVASILAEVPKLHVLVNNAGVTMAEKVLNEDGFELTFMVNYLAPYLLATGLFERLRAHAPARVLNVNTAPLVQASGKFDLAKTPAGLDFSKAKTYGNSKLANGMLTLSLAEEWQGSGVTINAFHPGAYKTKNGDKKLDSWPLDLIASFFRLFRQPLVIAGDAPYYLATDESLAQTTGQLFDRQQLSKFAKQVYDGALRRQLHAQTRQWAAV